MSNIGSWSTTAANNNATPPDGWPEGQAPSTVNNCAREMMSALRTQWNDAAWFNWYSTSSPPISLKSQNKIKISSNTVTTTDVYVVGRRIKVVSNNSTVYGSVASLSASSTAVIVHMTPDSGTLTSTVTSVAVSIIEPTNSPLPSGGGSSPSGDFGGKDNMLLNSNFQVAQLGTSFTSATSPANNDDTYLLDQWVLLSDGNDIVDVSQDSTNMPTGSGFCLKMDTETANKKFGVIQFLENKRSVAAVGRNVTLSFQAKKESGNATLETLRAAVLSWDSTADSITSDVVSAWGSAGTNPTLATNWTAENTATNLTLTNSYQTFTISNIPVDTASTANIAVFIWVDDTDATVGDIFYISNVKLEIGVNASEYSVTPFNEDLEACQRFLWKSFPYGTAPATGAGQPGGTSYIVTVSGTFSADVYVSFPIAMRIAPSFTFYNPVSANAKWYNYVAVADSGNASVNSSGEWGATLINSQVAGDNQSATCFIQAIADARL